MQPSTRPWDPVGTTTCTGPPGFRGRMSQIQAAVMAERGPIREGQERRRLGAELNSTDMTDGKNTSWEGEKSAPFDRPRDDLVAESCRQELAPRHPPVLNAGNRGNPLVPCSRDGQFRAHPQHFDGVCATVARIRPPLRAPSGFRRGGRRIGRFWRHPRDFDCRKGATPPQLQFFHTPATPVTESSRSGGQKSLTTGCPGPSCAGPSPSRRSPRPRPSHRRPHAASARRWRPP
jgi:hypothetical protein